MQTVAATTLKNKLGEVIDLAKHEPVLIQNHGRDMVVILNHAEYTRLRQLEDNYWIQRAEAALQTGFLTPEETLTRLQSRLAAESEA